MTSRINTAHLIKIMQDARLRTLDLVKGLSPEQLIGPKIDTINPLLWEIGHVAYFYEYFILRKMYGYDSLLGQKADDLYDSIKIHHKARWDLPLLSLEEILKYMENVQTRLIERLDDGLANKSDSFIYQYGVFHEDMHTEAFLWARQMLGLPSPEFSNYKKNNYAEIGGGSHPGFVDVPGGIFDLGGSDEQPFIFDNEKWSHPVFFEPFSIAKAPVTNSEFATFVEDKGYQRDELWSKEGLIWRNKKNNQYPCYWKLLRKNYWGVRLFDEIIPLPPNQPVCHVNWHEANAYCEWAGLRLPREVEWEVAALADISSQGGLSPVKRVYPWGSSPPTPKKANFDGVRIGCTDVGALPDGDSALGCRQMLGNIWEWTADTFQPYPGFSADTYKEYSSMLFGTTKVLRGGAWTARSRMLHSTYRNFFEPVRQDIFSGFRTCKVQGN